MLNTPALIPTPPPQVPLRCSEPEQYPTRCQSPCIGLTLKAILSPKRPPTLRLALRALLGQTPGVVQRVPCPAQGFPPAPSTAAARCSLGMDAGWARAPTMGTGARLERFYPEINRETSGEGKESKTRGPPPAPHHCNSGRSEAATCQSLPGGSFHPPPELIERNAHIMKCAQSCSVLSQLKVLTQDGKLNGECISFQSTELLISIKENASFGVYTSCNSNIYICI